MVTVSETLLCGACLRSSRLAESSAMSAVLLPSRFACPQQLWINTVSLPSLPLLPPQILALPASFLPALALLRATNVCWNSVRQFPLFKDSNVWSCLHRWQIHSSKMRTGLEIFTEGRARGQELLLFLFPDQYFYVYFLRLPSLQVFLFIFYFYNGSGLWG